MADGNHDRRRSNFPDHHFSHPEKEPLILAFRINL
jgi:hypothetical protein